MLSHYPLTLSKRRSAIGKDALVVSIIDVSGAVRMQARMDPGDEVLPVIYADERATRALFHVLPGSGSRQHYEVVRNNGDTLGGVHLLRQRSLNGRFLDRHGRKIGSLNLITVRRGHGYQTRPNPVYTVELRGHTVLRLEYDIRHSTITLEKIGELNEEDESLLLAGLCVAAAYQLR
ncbi:MAG: hypothetical protein JXB35_13710 [Anaerolineae bacterium]|nr:hypothetical protein [Anaerolineae bacterium]